MAPLMPGESRDLLMICNTLCVLLLDSPFLQRSSCLQVMLSKEFVRRVFHLCSTEKPDLEIAKHLLRSMSLESLGEVTHPHLPGKVFDVKSLVNKFDRVSAVEICEGPFASCVVFVLPQGYSLPLHDHPNQDVVCRVLQGKLGACCFDWEDPNRSSLALSNPREYLSGGSARMTMNTNINSGEMHCVEPRSGGVLHQFSGQSDESTVFCDFITPPYGAGQDNINCTYWEPERSRKFVGLFNKVEKLDELPVGTVKRLVPANVMVEMDCGFSSVYADQR